MIDELPTDNAHLCFFLHVSVYMCACVDIPVHLLCVLINVTGLVHILPEDHLITSHYLSNKIVHNPFPQDHRGLMVVMHLCGHH